MFFFWKKKQRSGISGIPCKSMDQLYALQVELLGYVVDQRNKTGAEPEDVVTKLFSALEITEYEKKAEILSLRLYLGLHKLYLERGDCGLQEVGRTFHDLTADAKESTSVAA